MTMDGVLIPVLGSERTVADIIADRIRSLD